MTVTIQNAQIYSINSELAYEIEYSTGDKVRAVEGANGWIRKEFKQDGKWVLSGKSYVVKTNKKRQAERLKDAVKQFLN